MPINREEKWKVLDWPSHSPDVYPTDRAFHLPNRRLKGLNDAVVKAWKGITNK